jgi:hypothetical protein
MVQCIRDRVGGIDQGASGCIGVHRGAGSRIGPNRRGLLIRRNALDENSPVSATFATSALRELKRPTRCSGATVHLFS